MYTQSTELAVDVRNKCTCTIVLTVLVLILISQPYGLDADINYSYTYTQPFNGFLISTAAKDDNKGRAGCCDVVYSIVNVSRIAKYS